jgi:hypothetical protein
MPSPSGIAVCPEADSAAVALAANGASFATCPAHRLAVAVARHLQYHMPLDPAIQHGAVDGTRFIQDIGPVLRRIQDPRTPAGAPVVIQTQETYQIYNCLKTMPNCIQSMETTRGDHGGVIGTQRPLQNTICVAIHHIDDKSYGGLCVLREWGATDMATIFVGYNPLQTMIWRDMLNDIPDDRFSTCILQAGAPAKDSPSWAEGIYSIVDSFSKFPADRPLPSPQFNRIFDGSDHVKNPGGKPLTFLDAQRSLAAHQFLQAVARARNTGKHVFVWEDGGYLNPIIDQAIHDNRSVAQFRQDHMLPDDPGTDGALPPLFADAMRGVFLGSVELTRNGYDMTAALAEVRALQSPFFSIAASYEKIMLEGDSIALACLDALSQVLYSTGLSLRERNVLVMGARGNLGRLFVGHLANILKDARQQVWGCDLKLTWPAPKPGSIPEWAKGSAPDVPLTGINREVVTYQNLSQEERYGLEVIFGWTGGPTTRTEKDPVTGRDRTVTHPTIQGQDVAEWLTLGTQKAHLFLVSGSTKTVEFADVLTWLEALLNQPAGHRLVNGILLDSLVAGPIPDQLSIAAVAQMWPGPGAPPATIKRNFGTQFTFQFKQGGVPVTKTLYLVCNTMPINFMYYGTPTEIMDLTYSQVSSCAAALWNNQKAAPGVYPTDYNRLATREVYLSQPLDRDYPFPPSL